MKQIHFYNVNKDTGQKQVDPRVTLFVHRFVRFKMIGLNLQPLKDEGIIKIKFLGFTIFNFKLKKGQPNG